MIRATWRKGWVGSDEKGWISRRIHNIPHLTEVQFIDDIDI